MRLGDEDILRAVESAEGGKDIRESASLFGISIAHVIELIKEREHLRDTKWTGKLGNFLAKLYPLVTTSLRLTSAIGGVCS